MPNYSLPSFTSSPLPDFSIFRPELTTITQEGLILQSAQHSQNLGLTRAVLQQSGLLHPAEHTAGLPSYLAFCSQPTPPRHFIKDSRKMAVKMQIPVERSQLILPVGRKATSSVRKKMDLALCFQCLSMYKEGKSISHQSFYVIFASSWAPKLPRVQLSPCTLRVFQKHAGAMLPL